MKIFTGGISTETNTFAMIPTGSGGFVIDRNGLDPDNPWNGVIRGLAQSGGHEVAWGLQADAQPSGPTVRAVYEALRDELLEALKAALPVDAVILPLHGAMVAEGYPDCEGDLLERVRALVGETVPIGVELDPHCHFTERMRRNADIIIAYKEYPHTDAIDRFHELWNLTLAAARREIRPVTGVYDCRMVDFWHTTREPMSGFVQRMKSLEGQGGVLSVSFGHGFPYGDVPEAGSKIWVVTDGDPELANALAEELGREVWAMRGQVRYDQISLEGALERVGAHPGPPDKPLILADIADNAGGGASSDSTFILQGLVDRAADNIAIGAFWDLGAVRICCEAGVGAELDLRVGGKCGPASGAPVDLRVTVRRIVEDHAQSMLGYAPAPCGPSVWVSTPDGLDLVLISLRQQVYGTDMFTRLGIDLTQKRAVVVKSSQHFRAEFAPLASDILYVRTPGLLRTDFDTITYRHRDPNFWPQVPDPWAKPAKTGGRHA